MIEADVAVTEFNWQCEHLVQTEKLEKAGFLHSVYLSWPPAAFREVSSHWGRKAGPAQSALACPH